jgi:hypothetical protein
MTHVTAIITAKLGEDSNAELFGRHLGKNLGQMTFPLNIAEFGYTVTEMGDLENNEDAFPSPARDEENFRLVAGEDGETEETMAVPSLASLADELEDVARDLRLMGKLPTRSTASGNGRR